MLPFTRDDAVCLSVTEFSNTSLIATYLTRSHGRVSALAKGARRKGSAFFGEIEPLTRAAIVWIPRKRSTLATLTESSVTSTYRLARHDLERLHAALYVIELVRESAIEGEPQPALFELTCRALERIAENRTYNPLTVAIFELRALGALGLGPQLDACAECGVAVAPSEAAWAPQLGGLACRACAVADRDRQPLSPGALAALRALATPDAPAPRVPADLLPTLRRHLDALVACRLERRLALARYLTPTPAAP